MVDLIQIIELNNFDRSKIIRCSNGVPLYKKGEVTEKQPVWIGDVAAGIVAAMKDPESSGRTYQFVG